MIKRFFVILPLLGNIFFCSAQQQALPQQLSLKEAKLIALQNNTDLQLKELQVAISQKEMEEAKWKKIPDVYVNVDVRRNLIIPTTPVPAKAFDSNAPEDKIKPLKFMTKWSGNTGINVKMDLFNPETHGLVKEQKQQTAIKEAEKEITINELLFQIGKDYAAVIIARKQLELAIADTLYKEKVLKMSEAKKQAGRIKLTTLNQVKSTKNETISQYWKAVKIMKSKKAQFILDLGYTPSKNEIFTFTDSIESLLNQFEGRSFDFANPKRLTLAKWNKEKRLTETQIRNTRQGFLPTLSLEGFYGGNYYDNAFNILKGEHWYGNSYIGLSLNIPITQGVNQIKKLATLQLQKKEVQLNLQSQQNKNQLAITQALLEWEYRKKDLRNKEKEMRFSKSNLAIAKNQFIKGRLLIEEFTQSNYRYQKAKTNYLQAAYDLIIAGMQLEKETKN